jgi:hypothetical protein
MIVLCAVAAVVVALVVTGCENKSPEESWTYVGTWVNSAYTGNNGNGPPAKLEMTASLMTFYDNVTTAISLNTGTFAIADDWTSGGDHYFKGIAVVSATTNFFLLRVTNNNNTLETTSDVTSYPAVIDSTPGSHYAIFARQ